MDEIKSLLDRLASLNEQEMSDLEAKILSEYETVESQEHTPDSVDSMFALADALEAVRTEQSNRVAAAKELESRAAEAAARIRGPQDAADDTEEALEEEVGDEVQTTEPVETTEEEKEEDEEVVVPATASTDEVAVEESTAGDNTPGDVAEASADDAATDEEVGGSENDTVDATTASTDTPEAAEAATEETAATEAAVEDAAEASTETPAEAEASIEEDTETTPAEPVTASADDSTATATDSQEETPMTASGSDEIRNDDAALSRPESHAPVASDVNLVTITAGADIPGISAGSTLPDMKAVASSFTKRLDTIRRVSGGDGEQHVVASFQTSLPEDRILGADRSKNVDLINAALAPTALTAAGVCAPIEAYYEVPGLGVVDRPVRSALVGFGADRGGIRFVPAPALTSFISESNAAATAVGLWDGETGDRKGGLGTGVKPCLVVDCGTEDSVYVDAVTACLVFDNMNARAHPEMVAQNNELALVAHARLAELTLLRAIKAAGTARTASAATTPAAVGFARQFLFDVEITAARYRQTHRLSDSTSLRAIIPTWVKAAIRSDLVFQAPGDYTFDKADNEIETFFSKRNISVGWSLESLTAFGSTGQGRFPTTVEWDLFAEGTFLFVDGGNLDLGIIRDSSLVETNAYKQFVETFEAVAKIGTESIHVTSPVALTGAAAAFVDTDTVV
jgi:chemotaxis protein histidine kinase CheA